MKTIKDLDKKDLKDKTILMRVDYNVPLDIFGEVGDDFRIKTTLPTIRYLLNSQVKKIILLSHLGRPVIRPREKLTNIILGNSRLSLKPVAEKLADWLKIKVPIKQIDLEGIDLPGFAIGIGIVLLENIRFDWREELNDEFFAKELSSLGNLYVNDAFGSIHNNHTSIVALAKKLPSYAGLLVKKEIEVLDKLLSNPSHPFTLILGGSKVYEKMAVLGNLSKKVDQILLGGVMASTFMKTRNIDIKKSVYEENRLDLANKLFGKIARKIYLPTDLIWEKDKIIDIGSGTAEQFKKIINKAKTIFWNGPLGLTSPGLGKYGIGTKKIAQAVANSRAISIICGGDTIAEINKAKLASKISYISTGGGATLKFLAGEELPGLEVLK